MERVANSQNNNHIDGSQAIQDAPKYAIVQTGALVPCPAEHVQVSIFSYTWRDFKLDSPVTERKHTMCTQHAQLVGKAFVQLDTCFKFNDRNIMPQEDMNILQYSWYQRAAVCLVYLQDVTYDKDTDDHDAVLERLGRARWLTEPWALQELILRQLSEWTGIKQYFLSNPANVRHACIAKRMSWAATRNYDSGNAVYSLREIFNVSLTPKRDELPCAAFRRLQMKLIQKYPHDLSIFAWKVCDETVSPSRHTLFANSPKEFASCSKLQLNTPPWPVQLVSGDDEKVVLNLPLHNEGRDYYLLSVNSHELGTHSTIAIMVKWIREMSCFIRVDLCNTYTWSQEMKIGRICVEASGQVKYEPTV
ncbi:hypothetical protein ABOM_003301 [Aspergillus bombycis]|uniref:Heterokaryon incompatibility domain-containing protein n=1 Tax=Aspergillus bombycis TaxID=109264 RepID=A0A1F8A7W0_9EURO|nr:hypothetical protein ABOM_003301 [Aspergillus bombycis]OGM47796.1 hypothetical protein ABOM_003301 [Aspergillus bombycis]